VYAVEVNDAFESLSLFCANNIPQVYVDHCINEYLQFLGFVAGDADFHDFTVIREGYMKLFLQPTGVISVRR
jgi:hypothetical protein